VADPRTSPDLTPEHLPLGQLIDRLRREPDQSRRVKIGFGNPHSYRGYYEDVAFEIVRDVTVGDMLAAAESALGNTYGGWKGDEFTMGWYTNTWLVSEWGDCGESIGAVPLGLMLDDSAYRAGQEVAARAVERFGAELSCHECGPDVEGFAAAARGDQPRTLSGCDGEDNPEEQAPIDMGYMSLSVETQRAIEIAAWSAAQDNPEEQR
jgi:hypothetical protein